MAATLGIKTKVRRAMPIGVPMTLDAIAALACLFVPVARRALNKMHESGEVTSTGKRGSLIYTRQSVTINPPHIHLNPAKVISEPAYTFSDLPAWLVSFPVPHQVAGRVHSLAWED